MRSESGVKWGADGAVIVSREREKGWEGWEGWEPDHSSDPWCPEVTVCLVWRWDRRHRLQTTDYRLQTTDYRLTSPWPRGRTGRGWWRATVRLSVFTLAPLLALSTPARPAGVNSRTFLTTIGVDSHLHESSFKRFSKLVKLYFKRNTITIK